MVKLNININISNRSFILIGVLLSFILIGGIIIAYNPSGTANPAIMGHNIEEIEGLNDTIDSRISAYMGGDTDFVCDPTPIFNTSYSQKFDTYKYDAGVIDVPVQCKSVEGCIIKQIIKKSSGPYLMRVYSYYQDDISNLWSSSSGASGTNGDSTAKAIIPDYASSLYFWDDYPKKCSTTGCTDEKNFDKWTIFDKSTTYGMEIYICSPSTA